MLKRAPARSKLSKAHSSMIRLKNALKYQLKAGIFMKYKPKSTKIKRKRYFLRASNIMTTYPLVGLNELTYLWISSRVVKK